MVKVPKKVGASFGQGVSRRSYQVARGLGQKGTGAVGMLRTPTPPIGHSTPGMCTGQRNYAKNAASSSVGSDYTASEMANPDLSSLNQSPGGRPPPQMLGMRRTPKGFTL